MTESEVQLFLKDFKVKMQVMDIVFLDERAKNAKTLALLEISPAKRKQIIRELEVQDYAEGSIEEVIFLGSPLWVFGKYIKSQEVYIKISMGMPNRQTLCVSFHIAEYPMKYPFKS